MGGLCSRCVWKRSRRQPQDQQQQHQQQQQQPQDPPAHAAINRSDSAAMHDGTPTPASSLEETAKSFSKRDLEAMMFVEDGKRAIMLDTARSQERRDVEESGMSARDLRRQRDKGRLHTSAAFRAASGAIKHCLVCSACGWRAAGVAGAKLNSDKGSRIVAMDDSSVSIKLPQALPPCRAAKPGKAAAAPSGSEEQAVALLCQGGLDGVLTAPPAGRVWTGDNTDACEQRNTVCKGCRCFLGLTVGGTTYLCLRYVRVVEAVEGAPLFSRVPLNCSACAATLSYTDQVLCTKRRWSFANTPSQPACYVNSVVSCNVVVKSPCEMHLAQGRFVMAEVHCRCGKQVGYKFCRDLTRDSRNVYQVGRFGLVSSCFTIDLPTAMP